MDFKILRKIIYSDEFVGLDLKQFYEIKEIVDLLKLPLMSRITDFYGHNITFLSTELEDLDKEIDKVVDVPQDAKNIELLNNLKKLVKQAMGEQKPIEVLTD